MIPPEELVGKWLWTRNSRIHVLAEDKEPNFFIVEEPEMFPEPRPLHYSTLKDAKIIEADWRPNQVSIEVGECGPSFCSCGSWRVGKPFAELTVQSEAEEGQLDKCLKELQKFFDDHHGKEIKVHSACSYVIGDKVKIRFIAL